MSYDLVVIPFKILEKYYITKAELKKRQGL